MPKCWNCGIIPCIFTGLDIEVTTRRVRAKCRHCGVTGPWYDVVHGDHYFPAVQQAEMLWCVDTNDKLKAMGAANDQQI